MAWKPTKYTGVKAFISARRWKGKPDMVYYIAIRYEGRLKWEKVGRVSEGYTAELASQIRSERIQDLKHGKSPAVRNRNRKKITFGEAWDKYRELHLPQTKSRDAADDSRYKNHLRKRFGNMLLSTLGVLDLEKMRLEMRGDGYSDQTIHHCLALVRRVINKARKWGLWQGDNPVSKMDMPKPDNKRMRFLSAQEAQMLLEEICCRSRQWWRISLLSLHTGMRFSEVAKLLWEDLDLANGVLHVREAKEVSRIVRLTPTSQAMLERMPRGRPGALAFPNRKGAVIREVSETFVRSVDALGLNEGVTDRRHRVVFHTLRHTFGSWLAQNGVPLFEIGKYMGHGTLEMTERYSHLCPDQQRKAARVLERAFTVGR